MAEILIVDDDPGICRAISRLLDEHGYTTHVVGTGEGAVAFLTTRAVDAVILDYMLPGMDGHQTLAAIRRRDPSLGVLLLTAYGKIPLAVAAMRLGAFDYLTKPFDNDILLIAVGRVLELRRLGGTPESHLFPELIERLRRVERGNLDGDECSSAVVARLLRIATSPAVSIVVLGVCARALSLIWNAKEQPFRDLAVGLREMIQSAIAFESLPRDPAISAAVAKLEAAIVSHSDITEEDLAREFDLSPNELGEQIWQTTGLTIPEYKRVGRVRVVLPSIVYTAEHVRQIGLRAAYAHHTQLDRDFSLMFGMSPPGLRNQVRAHCIE